MRWDHGEARLMHALCIRQYASDERCDHSHLSARSNFLFISFLFLDGTKIFPVSGLPTEPFSREKRIFLPNIALFFQLRWLGQFSVEQNVPIFLSKSNVYGTSI